MSVYVLDEAQPRALAFGPAHLGGTANPGDAGNSVLVAHRDTHFAFLRHVAIDDEIDIETRRGQRVRYRVREAFVVDKEDMAVAEPVDGTRLTLVTCWPFDAIRPGTRLRYVVVADRVHEPGDAPRSPSRGA
jgi:sortase A